MTKFSVMKTLNLKLILMFSIKLNQNKIRNMDSIKSLFVFETLFYSW